MFLVGGNVNLAFLNTNMLVYPMQNFTLAQGGGDTGFRKGGIRITVKYLNAAHSRAYTQRFFPPYDVWYPKKGGS